MTKNYLPFSQTMSLCDHLKQSESIYRDENPQEKGCPSTGLKHRKSPLKKQKKSVVVLQQLNLDNFITESPCDEADTLVGIDSIVDEDVNDIIRDKLFKKGSTPTSQQRILPVQSHKAESKISPQASQKFTVQNLAKSDPLLDFINDLSDGSGDETSPPKQVTSEVSDVDHEEEEEDIGAGYEISDPFQASEKNLDPPSPPVLDILDNSFEDAQNFDGEDCQNFTQTFDLGFDTEEDFFCDPQFDCTIEKDMTEHANKSNDELKLENRHKHLPDYTRSQSDGRIRKVDEKVGNANPISQNEATFKLNGDDRDLHTSDQTNLLPRCDANVKDAELTADALKVENASQNSKLEDTRPCFSSKGNRDNVLKISPTNDRNVKTPDKDSEEIFSNSINIGIPNFDLNASVDIFSPNFDFGFDVDCTDSVEHGSKDVSGRKSPVLTNSRKIKKERQSKENSPGHITITQKVENRVLFADLGKAYDTSKTPIAQVKPHVQSEKAANASDITTMPNHGHDMDHESPVLIMRHKRSLDNSEYTVAKRKKDSLETHTCRKDSSKLPEDSRSVEDSPFFVLNKRKSQTKKLEFSPDSEKSEHSPDKDKSVLLSRRKEVSSKAANETPVCRKRRSDDSKMRHVTVGKGRKHSTPRALVSSDELSDDDFKGADKKRQKVSSWRRR